MAASQHYQGGYGYKGHGYGGRGYGTKPHYSKPCYPEPWCPPQPYRVPYPPRYPPHCYPCPPPCLPKPKCRKKSKVVKVDKNITTCTTWTRDKIWLVSAEVHVKMGAKLCIEKGTTVLFKECPLKDVGLGGVPYATLVVDSGASICAKRVKFASQNGGVNNTGGLIICGTNASMTFGAYETIQSHADQVSGCSTIKCCSFSHLGNKEAGLDSLTFLQVKGGSEVYISNLSISEAGNNGWRIFGGDHNIDNFTSLRTLGSNVALDSNATLGILKSVTLTNHVNGQQPLAAGVVGPGLVEVIGAAGTNNVFVVQENAFVCMLGRITSIEIGVTAFSGLFAGVVAGQPGGWSGSAPPLTFIEGQNP